MDYIKTDKNILTYDIDAKNIKNDGEISMNGPGVEVRLGFIKTFSFVGIRAYGYSGADYSKGTTLPQYNLPKYIDKNLYTKYLSLSETYYGGIVDLIFGFFGYGKESPYFFIGGGFRKTI